MSATITLNTPGRELTLSYDDGEPILTLDGMRVVLRSGQRLAPSAALRVQHALATTDTLPPEFRIEVER